ncbi:hypothetical protein B0H14DRAFT_2566566 [Mycena olivaceomarginata]|nr:hypothetical protein B0H14DRAFT_2566566 [Mycena olivaceomarginata]
MREVLVYAGFIQRLSHSGLCMKEQMEPNTEWASSTTPPSATKSTCSRARQPPRIGTERPTRTASCLIVRDRQGGSDRAPHPYLRSPPSIPISTPPLPYSHTRRLVVAPVLHALPTSRSQRSAVHLATLSTPPAPRRPSVYPCFGTVPVKGANRGQKGKMEVWGYTAMGVGGISAGMSASRGWSGHAESELGRQR